MFNYFRCLIYYSKRTPELFNGRNLTEKLGCKSMTNNKVVRGIGLTRLYDHYLIWDCELTKKLLIENYFCP